MFKEGSYVTILGKLQVKEVGEEYVQLDPFEKGETETVDRYEENGFKEVTSDGLPKEFDGFQIGDFFYLTGKYKVLRSNEIFTKIELEGQMLSLPNHKLVEVE